MPLPTYLMSNFPSVRPSLNLQFDSQPTPEDMTSHLASVGATFSRASIGTYTDANGLIQEASAGQARPNYSTAGVHEGLLIEESRTNNFKISGLEYIAVNSSSNIFVGDYTITNFYGIAPNGKAQSTRLQSGSGSGNGIRVSGSYFGTAVNAGNNTLSVYIKVHSFGTSGTPDIFFNADGGRWVGITTGDVTIGEWTRIEGAYTPSANWIDIECTANCDFEIWGIQNEFNQSFATSYIPTIPTFSSRASTATYFDSDGVLQTASINEARTDHKYIDGQWVEAGLLLEGASTNLVLQSEDFSTTWTESANANLTVNQAVAPDGTTTADELEDTAVNSVFSVAQDVTTVATTQYTASVFVKPNTKNFVYMYAGGGPGQGIIFDLLNVTTGSNVGSAPDSARIERYGDYYRCEFTFTATDGSTNITVGLANSSSVFTYLGDGTGSVYIWGAQVEAQSQATSYIKTTTASATRSADVYTTATKTRSADVCYIDGTAFTDFYNQDESTLLANYILKGDLTNEDIFNINDGTTSNEIFLRYSSGNTLGFVIDETSGQQALFSSTSYDSLETAYKAIIAYKTNSVKLFVSGTQIGTTDTSAIMPTVSKIGIGYRSWGGDYVFNGTIKKLIYFPRQLSDNELIKLTQ